MISTITSRVGRCRMRRLAHALIVGGALGLTDGGATVAQAASSHTPEHRTEGTQAHGTRGPVPMRALDRPWVDEQLAANAVVYAEFVRTHPPDRFPYGEQVVRTWTSWWRLPASTTSPVSTVVTLLGWSGAQLLHGGYEALLGRFTEALAHGQATPEDLWAARVAQQEAQYRKTVKWYRFPVWPALHELWMNDWPTDVSLPRQLERRYAYTSAYAVQGAVAGIVGLVVGGD